MRRRHLWVGLSLSLLAGMGAEAGRALVPDRTLYGERIALPDGCSTHELHRADLGQVYLARVSYPATVPVDLRVDVLRGAGQVEADQVGSTSVAGASPRRALRNVEQELVLVGGDPAGLTSLLARTLHSGRGGTGGGQAKAVSVCAKYIGVLPTGTPAPTHVAYDIVLETMVWGVLPRASGTLVLLLAVLAATATAWVGPCALGILHLDFGRARTGGRRTD